MWKIVKYTNKFLTEPNKEEKIFLIFFIKSI